MEMEASADSVGSLSGASVSVRADAALAGVALWGRKYRYEEEREEY